MNLQNNKKTIWYCLCSPADTSCPFGWPFINTCTYIPSLSDNPNLLEVKVNCDEKSKYEQYSPNTINFTENCAVAATSESDFSSKFKIYPNPAKDFIGIETKEMISEISILDYSGKIISTQKDKFKHISLNHLPKGNYVMTINTLGKKYSYKFIKN